MWRFSKSPGQKQSPEVFYKKVVLRNFAKFTGKHLFQRLFLNKVAGLRPQDVKIILHDKRKQYENKITIKGKISPR